MVAFNLPPASFSMTVLRSSYQRDSHTIFKDQSLNFHQDHHSRNSDQNYGLNLLIDLALGTCNRNTKYKIPKTNKELLEVTAVMSKDQHGIVSFEFIPESPESPVMKPEKI